MGQVRLSKNVYYERPYTVIGGIQLAGPEQEPKGIYVRIELSERGKLSHILKKMVVTKNNKRL